MANSLLFVDDPDEIFVGILEDVLLRIKVREFLEAGVTVLVQIHLFERFVETSDGVGAGENPVAVRVAQSRNVESDRGGTLRVGFGDNEAPPFLHTRGGEDVGLLHQPQLLSLGDFAEQGGAVVEIVLLQELVHLVEGPVFTRRTGNPELGFGVLSVKFFEGLEDDEGVFHPDHAAEEEDGELRFFLQLGELFDVGNITPLPD